MTAAQLARLPWTFQGPVSTEEDGVMYWEIRIAELPDFIVIAKSEGELYLELNPALEAFMESYTELGQEPPVPSAVGGFGKNQIYAWQVAAVGPHQVQVPPAVVAEGSNEPLPGVAGSYVSRELVAA